jgi:hypothetical protein
MSLRSMTSLQQLIVHTSQPIEFVDGGSVTRAGVIPLFPCTLQETATWGCTQGNSPDHGASVLGVGTMRDGMMKMQEGMMSHMMAHMQAGSASMASGPMMKPMEVFDARYSRTRAAPSTARGAARG